MLSADELPILVVGAGPVGLSLALALARQGQTVHIFEKLPELSTEARASTFHPRTLEMFEEWGLIDDLLEHGFQVDCLQYWERENHELIATFPYSAIATDTPYPFRLQCPQSVLTRLLKPHLEALPNVHIHMQHELTDFRDHGSHVEASFLTPNGLHKVSGRYLCAADGSRSVVRQQLGIAFDGITYPDRFLLAACDLDFPAIYPDFGPVSYIFDPQEWVIVLHLPDVTRVVFRIRDDEDELAVQNHTAVRERINRFISADHGQAYQIFRTSIYSVHQRVAETFRQGNVLLLGDSAHINNPMGGMGMNSGIHDAYHLATALQIARSNGDQSALDHYSQQRRQFALDHVQLATDRNYRDMVAGHDSERQRRNAFLQRVAANPDQLRAYLINISMLNDRIPLPFPELT